MKKNNGITLIALVITIIVLLILAGVSINMITGDDGIISKASTAAEKTKTNSDAEEQKLKDTSSYIDEKVNHTGNSDSSLNISGTVPEGGTYYVGVTSTTLGDYTGYTSKYESGDSLPETVNDGDVFIYEDYEYRYNMYPTPSSWTLNTSANGWGVCVTDKTKDAYTEIASSINNQSITDMRYTFYKCTNLINTPSLPNTVKTLHWTFEECSSLTNAPIIPDGVTSMNTTFGSCTALTTAPVIPDSVTNMQSTFSYCTNLVSYVGAPEGTTEGDFSQYKLPSNLTSLYCGFQGCKKLTKAPTIPQKVTDLRNAFYPQCTNLTGELSVPCTLTTSQISNAVLTSAVTIVRYHVDDCTGTCGY